MRITILNGEPDAASAFDAYQCALTCRLHALGHTVEKLDLRALDLKGCTGCFNCWIKTPGECSKSDDSATVRRAVMNCDLVLLAAPITMGFTTALLKRAADQMIPLIHPYFVVEGGELHHRARYARYPKFGLLLCASPDTRRRRYRDRNRDVAADGAQHEVAPGIRNRRRSSRRGGSQ